MTGRTHPMLGQADLFLSPRPTVGSYQQIGLFDAPHDARCRASIAGNPNLLVPWVLSAAYAYEHLAEPIISDGLYDELSRELAQHWASVKHFHKHVLRREWFPKGSIPLTASEYPHRIVGATKVPLLSTEDAMQ
jgi:hypothetical protein